MRLTEMCNSPRARPLPPLDDPELGAKLVTEPVVYVDRRRRLRLYGFRT